MRAIGPEVNKKYGHSSKLVRSKCKILEVKEKTWFVKQHAKCGVMGEMVASGY